MNWLDIVLIIIWLFFSLLGLRAGFVNALVFFVGGFLGVYFGGRYSEGLAERFSFAGGKLASKIISFIIIFLVVIACLYLIGFGVRKLLKFAFMGWADRLLGFLFGAGLGWAICGGVLFILTEYVIPHMGEIGRTVENAVNSSTLYPFFSSSFPFLLRLLPFGG